MILTGGLFAVSTQVQTLEHLQSSRLWLIG